MTREHNPGEPEPISKTITGKTILLIVLPAIVLHFVFFALRAKISLFKY
jgi:hypothetical protein